ncbi:FAD synthase [Candidatus Woesearchaeota archaeon]|nr:FAD synthase [Candidatus Woesearchaeota archaeon]
MKIVMAFGSFDLLHKGHLYYLNESKKYGDKLIVVVARDVNIINFKGKSPLYNEQERVKQVRKLSVADKVILGNKGNIFDILTKIKPDVICLGYDQKPIDKEMRKELKIRNINAEIIRINPYNPKIYKSSKLKSK